MTAAPGGDGLGDVAGILDAAVGDHRHAGSLGRARSFQDGRDLRHARAGHHARGADRARADADFDAVDAQRDQIARAFVRCHVAGDQLHFRQALLHRADRVHHARGMPVRRIHGQHVHLGARQFHGALQKVSGGADGRAHPQAALLVLGGVRETPVFSECPLR